MLFQELQSRTIISIFNLEINAKSADFLRHKELTKNFEDFTRAN